MPAAAPPLSPVWRESSTDTGQSSVDRPSACLSQSLHGVGRDQGASGRVQDVVHTSLFDQDSTFSALMAGTAKHDVVSLSFGEEGNLQERLVHAPASHGAVFNTSAE